ncbi:DUF2345 domain-containing protein [Halomonas mongoliensis]|uniref:DUF2345 domain-containing protein n=1 Tax=Halomonas mongoliensis TaxID=321265 RepID=UPI00403B2A18
MHAGAGWGGVFVPRIGQEVIVDFLEGDPDHTTAQGASQGGRGEAARLSAPWLHLASPAGIALSTPESSHLAQGRSLSVTSGEDINLAAGRSLIASLSEKLSLFVQRAGIKLFAARGKVELQAQSDNLELTAEKDVKITSTECKVRIEAADEILLTSGGGYVRIKGGDTEIHGPGRVDVKGAQHSFGGPTSMGRELMTLPESQGLYSEFFTLRDEQTQEPLKYAKYRIETAEGEVFEGRSGRDGRTEKVFTKKPQQLKVTVLDRLDDEGELLS